MSTPSKVLKATGVPGECLFLKIVGHDRGVAISVAVRYLSKLIFIHPNIILYETSSIMNNDIKNIRQ